MRWIGQDGHGSVERIKALAFDAIVGLIDGQRLDETLCQIRQIERETQVMDEGYIQLQHAATVEQLVDWIMNDETVLTLVRARLGSPRVCGKEHSRNGEAQP